MGAAGDLGAYQGGLRVKDIGVDALQRVPAVVVIAVARGGGKMSGVDPVFLQGQQDFILVIFGDLVNARKALGQHAQDLLAKAVNGGRDAQTLIHGLIIQ